MYVLSDCWEDCQCRSLIAGAQQPRFALLNKLLTETGNGVQLNKRVATLIAALRISHRYYSYMRIAYALLLLNMSDCTVLDMC